MSESPLASHASSPADLQARLRSERAGAPFLVLRDGEGAQQIHPLDNRTCVRIGRGDGSDLRLPWDRQVSRVHAELTEVGGEWAVQDDGLSRNGTQVNGERLTGRRRLVDGDVVRVGDTLIAFRSPGSEGWEATVVPEDAAEPLRLSEAQRRVLVALCRPFKGAGAFAAPPGNQEIADELFLSVDTVKTHMRALFEAFGLERVPQSRKRLALVERAFATGAVSEHDL